MIPLAKLSAMVFPVGRSIVVLKVYLDDSGDDTDPNCESVAIAGYVGTIDQWEVFERLWQADVLDEHKAPYLHMKEFVGRKPPFDWEETKRRSFLGSAAKVIRDTGLRGIGEVIRLDDLRRFNRDRGFKLLAIPLALYGCMISLFMMSPDTTYEVVIDRIKKASSVIAKAEEYAQSSQYDDVSDKMSTLPLKGDLTFRNVLPMQAADFAAYEVLKYNRRRPVPLDVGNPPLRRKSYDALLKAAHIQGNVWHYRWLSELTGYRGGTW